MREQIEWLDSYVSEPNFFNQFEVKDEELDFISFKNQIG